MKKTYSRSQSRPFGTLATTFGRLPIGNYLSRRILRLEHSVANTKRGKETIVSALCDFLVARVVPLRKCFKSRIKSNKYFCFNELREGTENGVCRAFEAGLNSFFDPLHMKLSIAAQQLPCQGFGGGPPN